MSGTENSGRTPLPLEVQALKTRGDGLLPGGHRMKVAPKGTTVAMQNADPGWQPPDPPLRRDGIQLCNEAKQLHQQIWWSGRSWMHLDKDFWWVDAIARNEDTIVRNSLRIAVEGEMGKFGHMGERGGDVEHPLLDANRKLEKINAGYFQRNGFDAASRAKLQIADVIVANGLADFEKKAQEKFDRDDNAARKAGNFPTDGNLVW